ncbi:LptA/OstA family protein [Nostoc sp.]|uniref:LptA/OstA family protein n=1 Tax=Nostoc sp. TaxID=1180 RepID=UPI002FF71EFD
MNFKSDKPTDLSELDIELLSYLSDLATEIEPDRIFQVQLETKLLQAHQSALQKANPINISFRRWNRHLPLIACVSLAITVILGIPTITSRQLPQWIASLVNSTVDTRANAQTIAQLIETGKFTLQSDVQEYNKDTQELKATGNATFVYSEAQIQASADEIRFVPTGRQIILSGNVQILQKGKKLRGRQATCYLDRQQCTLSQD